MYKLLAILAVAAVAACTVSAQTVVTLGDLNGASNNFPFNYSSNNGRFQHAYDATEINLPGGGLITEVRVHGSILTPATYNNFRLRLGHSTLTPLTITGTFDTNYIGTLETVIGDTGTTNPVAFTPTTATSTIGARQWYVFQLTTPFLYNGTDTLLLDWSYDSRIGTGWLISSSSGRNRVYSNGGGATTPTGSSSNSGNVGVEFHVLLGPMLTVDATPGTAQSVYTTEQGPGGEGIVAGKFDLSANTQGPVTFDSLTITASGSGNDSNAFTQVGLYRDDPFSGTQGSFDPGTDPMIATALNNFVVDDGSITFNIIPSPVEQQLGISETRTYFIVVKLAGTASPGDTFDFTVSDANVLNGDGKSGFPSQTMNGLIIATPEFEFTDASASSAEVVYLGSSGNVCQAFDIEYLGGPDDRPGPITVNGLGSADESTDLMNVQLWYDSDQSGSFDAQLDALVDSQVFGADNGSVTFGFTSHATFAALDVRRFFVVYNLNNNADDGETFQSFISAMGTAAFGGVGVNLPAPSANGTLGLIVSANVLTGTLNGPLAAVNVNSNTTGPHGDGVVLADVTLAAAPGAAWTVNSMTFHAAGTGDFNNAFSELALYQDEGSTTWDGAAIDTLAATVQLGFSGGAATFTLTSTAFAASTQRRFYLVGKMNGTAQTGETFNANLQSVDAIPPAGGAIIGLPTLSSTALIIDTAAVTVANAPTQPAEIWHRQGSSQHYVVGRFRLNALNNTVTVNGITLTTGGTGNWATDVDNATGVEVYLDDGDGTFDAGADSLLFQGGGGATVNCQFTNSVVMPITSEADLWIRVGLTDVAGLGAIAGPNTYTAEIADIADVNATSAVVLGTPAPQTTALGAIEFDVSSFSPSSDLPAGGKAITIDGSGFVAPVSITIGGIICPGTPQITGGTQITGVMVPNGGGTSLPIVVTSGNLPPQTLAQTFSYRNISTGSGSSGGSGGCSFGGGSQPFALLAGLLALLAMGAAVRLKRREA